VSFRAGTKGVIQLLLIVTGSRLNIWSCEFVTKHLRRYDKAAEMPAIRTGRRVSHVNIAPVSRILIIPVITAVRNAIRRPLMKSFQSRVRNFDFIAYNIEV